MESRGLGSYKTMTRPEYVVERLDRTLVEDVKRTEKVLKELGVFERLEKWLEKRKKENKHESNNQTRS